MELIKKFFSDERGLETVEYAIIVGIIVAGTVVVILSIAEWVNEIFGEFEDILTDVD